ncbi:MAG: hypothetical protein IPM71_13895 [Bacteroidota bacterium]|nr:MAG: hypothetical protein IPM71_13895 [Bacteroidota bacterium]
MKRLLYLLIFVFTLFGCSRKSADKNEIPVARVYDKYLYVSDLKSLIPENLAEADSIALSQNIVAQWVKKQLILAQANSKLSEADKNVEKQLDDYLTSLLIFRYEQKLIQQRLDTNITQAAIEAYYKENASNNILNENLAKGIYLKIPISAPDIRNVRQWYRSDNPEHIKNLEAYCYQFATEVEYFEDQWVRFDSYLNKLPPLYNKPKSILQTQKNIEVADTGYYYFLRIVDYRLEGTVAPLEYVQENIKNILLNKRKIQFIQQLEADIYNDALNKGNFNIYQNE